MKITKGLRRVFFLLLYPFLWAVSIIFALYIVNKRFIPAQIGIVFSLLFIFRVFMLNAFHLFDVSWRFVSVGEVFDLLIAMLLAEIPSVLLFVLLYLPYDWRFYFVEFIMSLVLSIALLSSKRVYLTLKSDNISSGKRKALLVGDAVKVEKFLRNIADSVSSFVIQGVVATDNSRKGDFIRGVRIIGNKEDLLYFIRNRVFDLVYVIEDSLEHKMLKDLIKESERNNIRLRIISVDIGYRNTSIFTIREVDTEDLLFRREVKIETDAIEKFINHKRVLITGAAGSIGSELSYQVARFTPLKLILLDIDETNIFLLAGRLKKQFPYLDIEYYVADVTNTRKIESIFVNEEIDVVFHAAAYKHVPVMEKFPDEAVRVNVIGTYNVAKIAAENSVSKFILISTDKAVKPVSIMGATKYLAEKIVISLARKYRNTQFIAVRFGNVLGSRGSVVPIFMEQIKQGGPVTITHPDMERFFMTTKEAVLLVLEAGAVGKSGEIYVLDMGEPVKIVDLAEELIRLHGLEPNVDIKIEFTGKRPGEKLTEELYSSEEDLTETQHEKLLRLKPNGKFNFDYEAFIDEAKKLLANYDVEGLRSLIRKYI